MVYTGSSPHGQGEETTFAQIVSEEFGIPIDNIMVLHGDTDSTPEGRGTYGSRSTAVGGSRSIMKASRLKRENEADSFPHVGSQCIRCDIWKMENFLLQGHLRNLSPLQRWLRLLISPIHCIQVSSLDWSPPLSGSQKPILSLWHAYLRGRDRQGHRECRNYSLRSGRRLWPPTQPHAC